MTKHPTQWQRLNDLLATLDETGLAAALRAEQDGENRARILTRIHQRLAVCRTRRERLELLRAATAV